MVTPTPRRKADWAAQAALVRYGVSISGVAEQRIPRTI
jgi:hypothetical protein